MLKPISQGKHLLSDLLFVLLLHAPLLILYTFVYYNLFHFPGVSKPRITPSLSPSPFPSPPITANTTALDICVYEHGVLL